MKYPTISGFVGFRGNSVWLDPNGYSDDHPIVHAHPDLFTDTPPPGVEAPKPKRGRPAKAQQKETKTAASDVATRR